MDIELVTIGTELLLGFTVDTNGAVLGAALAEIGIRVPRRTVVGDEPAAIEDAVRSALARTGAVITTGGLGPTRDDVSKLAVARIFSAEVRFDSTVWDAIVARFRRLGREPAPANRSQAEVPVGAQILPNRWGTAPGLWLEGEPGLVVMLPGVPSELRKLVDHELLPRLRSRAGGRPIRSLTVRTASIPESAIAERVGPLEESLRPLSLAYLPGLPGVDLRLTAWDLSAEDAARRLEEAARRLEQELGDRVYGRDGTDLAERVLDAFRQTGTRLAIAESCTGGLLGERLTAIPGSSDVFLGGVICYDDRLKQELVGVDPELIARHGAVSLEVAEALAAGVRERLGADASVAITGIAGPTGGTPEKPVGTVCFGWRVGPRTDRLRVVLPGDRNEIRERAAQLALHRLLTLARKEAAPA